MPSYAVTMPDGAKYQLDAADEGSLETAVAHLQAAHTPDSAPDPSAGGGRLEIWNPASLVNPKAQNFDTGISTPQWLNRSLSGAGEEFSNIGIGAEQRAVEAASQVAPSLNGKVDQLRQQVANQRELDAPLNATTAGKAGRVIGGTAALLPAMAIPGANTVVGAGLVGGAMGLLQPSTSANETMRNTELGTAGGAAGQWAGSKVAQAVGNSLSRRATTAAVTQQQNAARDAVLTQSRQAGYVVPPTDVNPSGVNTALESLSGKAATRQGAQAANAGVTDKLVSADLGLTPNAPLTRQAIAAVRQPAGQVYQKIGASGPFASDAQYFTDLAAAGQGVKNLQGAYAGIGSQANQDVQNLIKSVSVATHPGPEAVELSKFLRNQASTNFRTAFATGGDPEKLGLARAQSQVADAVEDMIGRNLQQSGNGALAQQWQDARTLIAKSYQAQSAFKGGHFDATKLAAQMNRGKPVSGGTGIAANFADQFGSAARLPKGGVGVSKLGAGVALGGLMTGHPLLATLPFASALARRGILSDAGQGLLASPSYAPGLMGTGALNLVGGTGRIGGLLGPALTQASP